MAYASQTALRSWWGPACRGPWATVSLNGLGKVTVKTSIVEATKALNQVLVAYKYKTRYGDTGAYNCRRVTGGSSYSLHAYGIAIDINWQSNPYSRVLITDMLRNGDGRMPYRIEDIRTKDGHQVWRWGGKFSGNRDAMHYEITCSPSALRSGINWATVYGGTVAAPLPPATTTIGAPVYRIYWYQGGDKPVAAYRCLCAYAEVKKAWIVHEAWWISSPAELQVWRDRGLKEGNTGGTPTPPRPSIQFNNGPYDNTK